MKQIHQKINSYIQNKSKDLILEHSTKMRYISNLEKKVKVIFYLSDKSKHKGSFYFKREKTCYKCYFKMQIFLNKKYAMCSLSWFKNVEYSNEKETNTLNIEFEAPLEFNNKEYSKFKIEIKKQQKSLIPCQTIIKSLIGLVKGMKPFPRN